MNDFSDVEKQLRQLRPIAPSEGLVARIEQAVSQPGSTSTAGVIPRARRLTINWLGLGLGLATAAVVLIFVRINLQQSAQPKPNLAAISPAPSVGSITNHDTLVPVGLTQVVYHTRDEGLHFSTNSTQPMRRIRSQKREIVQWRDPATGASLRISYPSEEVSLTPVSGE